MDEFKPPLKFEERAAMRREEFQSILRLIELAGSWWRSLRLRHLQSSVTDQRSPGLNCFMARAILSVSAPRSA